jgi:hypothetical protein
MSDRALGKIAAALTPTWSTPSLTCPRRGGGGGPRSGRAKRESQLALVTDRWLQSHALGPLTRPTSEATSLAGTSWADRPGLVHTS